MKACRLPVALLAALLALPAAASAAPAPDASCAACMQPSAWSVSIWKSNDTHDPNDNTDTLIPVRPNRR